MTTVGLDVAPKEIHAAVGADRDAILRECLASLLVHLSRDINLWLCVPDEKAHELLRRCSCRPVDAEPEYYAGVYEGMPSVHVVVATSD